MSNSSTTTETDLIEPIHPGEILMEDFIEGFGITQNKLAVSIGVPVATIVAARAGAVHLSIDAVLDFVYLMMPDAREHEQRLLDRGRGLLHIAEPTWTDVQRRRAEYAAWVDRQVEIDASSGAAVEVAGVLVSRIGAR